MTAGQIAYEAYVKKAGGVSLVTGDQLPKWDTLSYAIQECWEAAADAVLWR